MNSRRLIIQQMEADSGRSAGKSKSNAATGKASGHFQLQKKKKKTRRSRGFGPKKLIKEGFFILR